MSRYNLPKLGRYIALRDRALPKYPLWFRGGPRLRVMMPLFWMKLINRNEHTPPNHINVEVHPQMTKYDVKNYLEKIYQVPVEHVALVTVKGKEINHAAGGYLLRREPDKKYANIWLAEGQTFRFPDVLGTKAVPEERNIKEFEALNKQMEQQRQDTWQKAELPFWFR